MPRPGEVIIMELDEQDIKMLYWIVRSFEDAVDQEPVVSIPGELQISIGELAHVVTFHETVGKLRHKLFRLSHPSGHAPWPFDRIEFSLKRR